MKTPTFLIGLLISSISYAQDCCNTIDRNSIQVVTSNGHCVVTQNANDNCTGNKKLLASTLVKPKLKPYEIDILNDALLGVKFKTDSDELLPKSYAKLDDVSSVLKEHDDFKLVIEGYTDNTGSSEYNHTLSHNRANAAKKYLVDKNGIEESRITTSGFGEEFPTATNNTEEGKAKNRRVEFKIYYK